MGLLFFYCRITDTWTCWMFCVSVTVSPYRTTRHTSQNTGWEGIEWVLCPYSTPSQKTVRSTSTAFIVVVVCQVLSLKWRCCGVWFLFVCFCICVYLCVCACVTCLCDSGNSWTVYEQWFIDFLALCDYFWSNQETTTRLDPQIFALSGIVVLFLGCLPLFDWPHPLTWKFLL